MSNLKLKLTYSQLGYIMEVTGISDPNEAISYFAKILRSEGILPSDMALVVDKLMKKAK